MSSGLWSIVIGAASLLLVVTGTAIEPDSVPVAPKVTLIYGDALFDLERPPVPFDHDLHTGVLAPEGESCEACHHVMDEAKGDLVYLEGAEQACTECHKADARAGTIPIGTTPMMDAYHGKCLACHGRRIADGKRAGPVTCGRCHVKGTPAVAMPMPAGFEHALHMKVMEEGCEPCHHVYNEQSKATEYVKGEEINCRACHVREPGKAAPGMKSMLPPGVDARKLKSAFHGQCLTCHRSKTAEGVKAGPLECMGCHGQEAIPLVDHKPPPYPMAQKNPERLSILSPRSIMPAVPFEHKSHQDRVDTCKPCHHLHLASLVRFNPVYLRSHSICDQCHDVCQDQAEATGWKEGLDPDRIYHNEKSPFSCIGCHKERGGKGPSTLAPCTACHQEVASDREKLTGLPRKWNNEGPEYFTIDQLSDKYQGVYLPHEAHAEMINDCTVCHHYSPENDAMRCSACHAPVLMDPDNPIKPGIVGAYHQMCMRCHREMGIGPLGCTNCHLKKE